MTNQSAQPITEKNFARKLSEAFDGREWKPVVDIIKEVTGHEFAPEPKPLPTEPGAVIIATEVRGVKGEWVMVLGGNGGWFSPAVITDREYHDPEDITAWTEARIVPVAAAPVTLTEEQVGELWDTNRDNAQWSWTSRGPAMWRMMTATVNDALAQHAAPAEGEPIDVADVREGDRVRVELRNGDEATFTVTLVNESWIESCRNAYERSDIRSVRLLHREEA